MSFCLPKFTADAFRGKLKSGELDPSKLSDMSSLERREYFKSIVGDANAKQVNALFESKLILKNQQQGMISWAKQLLGQKPEVLRDTLARVEKMTSILEAKDLDSFLDDLVEKKLGIDISPQEAGRLVDLAKSVEKKKKLISDDSPVKSQERLSYGASLVEFKTYVEDLKVKAENKSLVEKLKNPLELTGVFKSVLSSLDNSFFGRQGINTLFTNPDIWSKAFLKSWKDIGIGLKGGDAIAPIKADIYSRPNALNGNYKRGKYDLGLVTEEAFPSSLPTRIPILGRLFSASEQAYNGAALRIRADLADRLIKNAENAGIDMTDARQAESLGKVVNSMSGRGSIGKLEAVGKEINAAMFSVKFLKANFDFLTAHFLDKKMSLYSKKIAAQNLLKVVGSTASLMVLADSLWPGSVEIDPRSANFGKIRIGDSRFDITGGKAAIVVLAARMLTGSTKSSITGKVSDLNEDKYGALNKVDVLLQFAEGKTSPALKAVIDNLKGKNFQGEKPTLKSTALGLVTPLPIITYNELQNNKKAADTLLAMILSGLGIGVNTYSKKNQ